MLECNPALTPAQIRELMVQTAVSVEDPKNGRSFPSLRALAAIEAKVEASDLSDTVRDMRHQVVAALIVRGARGPPHRDAGRAARARSARRVRELGREALVLERRRHLVLLVRLSR